MKTSKRFFAAAFMALCMTAFNACMEEASPILPEENDEQLVEMTFEASHVDTKSTFSNNQLGWEVDDKVAVYDGTAKREFSVVSVNGTTATITGQVAQGATEFYAVFPYSAARDLLPDEEKGKISIAMPHEQILSEGKNFDEDAFVTAGKIVDNKVTFKNVASLLRLNIPAGITSVALRGLDTDKIAGAATVTYTSAETPSVTTSAARVYSSSIVLKPAGETFTEGAHYIALLPTTFTKGFRVVYSNDKNEMAIKKSPVPDGGIIFPLNGGHDITSSTTAEKLTWIPNPLMDEEDLLFFVQNQDKYSGEEAKFGQNITLTKEWTPVDLDGILDGQGYTLSGLNVNVTGGAIGAMCSVEEGAVLKNLTVEGNITYTAVNGNIPAGLVGHLKGLMFNVVNKTIIKASSSNSPFYVGGCAGWVHGEGEMRECINEGTVEISGASKFGYAGGLAGVIYSSSGKGLVQDCVNNGVVKSTGANTNGLGGILGVLESGEVKGCINNGKVSASQMRSSGSVGGVVGLVFNNAELVTRVNQCVNDGIMEISATEFRGVGGIVGGIDSGTAAAEIIECENKEAISITTANASSKGGMDGFYLGGIVGGINAENTSQIVNVIKNCKNSGNISVSTTTGSSNSAKVGGICANTRGLVLIEGNENSAESVSLESTAAAKMLCSAGGIVGETGDPWDNTEMTAVTLVKNTNRAHVLCKTNTTETPAGGLIGYAFCPVTSSGNRNYGNIERAATDGASPSIQECNAGGLFGMICVSDQNILDEKADASFTDDMTFGDVKSIGRAGMFFGSMRSNSYVDFAFSNCVFEGRLTIKYPEERDVEMDATNWKKFNGTADGGYLWGYLKKATLAQYNFLVYTPVFGNASSYMEPETFTAWQQGYMDIHHISTGRGNCTFMILPDGTTMMVDAGDNGPDNPENEDGKAQKYARVPNESLTPGEWIVRYVSHFLYEAGLSNKLDHMLVTHFHNDHVGVGTTAYPYSPDGRYLMTGVSYVGSNLEVGNLVDRGYPDYDFPYTGVFDKNVMMDNYMKFINSGYNRVNSISGFEVGSADQFKLNTPRNDFAIRNVYCNGQVWTGSGNGTKNIVPAGTAQADMMDENLWSAVIKISYGDFDYHAGGDILGKGLKDWHDIETKVGAVIGETDVFQCNHHATDESMNASIIAAADPQAYIIPAWGVEQPGDEAMARMKAQGGAVYAAGPVTDMTDMLASGHVVVRVYEGGNEFQIFVLDDESTDYTVTYTSDKFTSR